jgi:hypothetical protein
MIVRNFISDVGFAAAGVVELRPQLCPALILGTACTGLFGMLAHRAQGRG